LGRGARGPGRGAYLAAVLLFPRVRPLNRLFKARNAPQSRAQRGARLRELRGHCADLIPRPAARLLHAPELAPRALRPAGVSAPQGAGLRRSGAQALRRSSFRDSGALKAAQDLDIARHRRDLLVQRSHLQQPPAPAFA
jgi:hypothetical protein